VPGERKRRIVVLAAVVSILGLAGAGSSVVAASTDAPPVVGTDAPGDAVVSRTGLNEPRGDVVSYSYAVSGTFAKVTLKTVQPVDPTGDEWGYQGAAYWSLDVDHDGKADYTVIDTGVDARVVTKDSFYNPVCILTADFSPTNGYSVSFPASCVGGSQNPDVAVLFRFDRTRSGLESETTEDWAPDHNFVNTEVASCGYRLVYSYGSRDVYGVKDPITNFSYFNFYGPQDRVVAAVNTPTQRGFWMASAGGGVYTSGDAHFSGSMGHVPLSKPIVGMAATPTGLGYWLVAADGGVFAFGDAPYQGSTGALALTKPIVGMAATASGQGYWLVAADGGVFAFGDAAYQGSTGALALTKPIVGMTATPTGKGYWLLGADGGVFAFGDAPFLGSLGPLGTFLNRPVAGMTPTRTGKGYWIFGNDGGVFTYGDAPYAGSNPYLSYWYSYYGTGVVGLLPIGC